MAEQIFYLRNRLLGSRTIANYADKPGLGLGVQNSYILVCAKCQEVWARLLHNHPSAYTQIVQRYCEAHAEYLSDGFISTPDYKWPDATTLAKDWPADAIRHDFQVALNRAEALTLMQG